MGVSVSDILSTMQLHWWNLRRRFFTKYGKQFRVMVQALPEARSSAESLKQSFVKTKSGAMAPISQFVTLEKSLWPHNL